MMTTTMLFDETGVRGFGGRCDGEAWHAVEG
jgi:hypothetical protein